VAYARHPLHCTALGKALLAGLPWSEASRLLTMHPRDKLTERTMVELSALRQELERSEARGYAVDGEERAPGGTCVAAPIRDHPGQVAAAVSVSGATFRMRKHGLERLGRLVRRSAAEASERLGAPLERRASRRVRP